MTVKKHEIIISVEDSIKIVLHDISRASQFAKFTQAGIYKPKKINNYKEDNKIESYHSSSPINRKYFKNWEKEFIIWSLNNSFNLLIESFFTFIEHLVFLLEINKKEIVLQPGDELSTILKKHQDEIRKKHRDYSAMEKALKGHNIILSKEVCQVINSFNEIRVILTHFRSIAYERKKLPVKDGKVQLWWYFPEVIEVDLASGKEMKINENIGLPNRAIAVRPRSLHHKVINIGKPVVFSFTEIQHIAYTFRLIINEINKMAELALKPIQ
ncbi:MAG: hypothetical protein FJX71_01080 [Alphaproteobacteria bacterium]|nr:hypothetical protein [Alphaproteobacteria bacterium]